MHDGINHLLIHASFLFLNPSTATLKLSHTVTLTWLNRSNQIYKQLKKCRIWNSSKFLIHIIFLHKG